MQFESDYIMRQILMAAEFIRRMLGLCEDQRYEEAARELDALCRRLTGLSMDAVAKLAVGGKTPMEQPAAAEMLAAYAVLQAELGEMEAAQNAGEAALQAICRTTRHGDIAAERRVTVETLLTRLPTQPTAETLMALAGFYRMARVEARMEDMLFVALEGQEGDARKEALAWGIAAFENWQGGDALPPEEREEALRILRAESKNAETTVGNMSNNG